MKTSKILKKAKAIISNPDNWTKYRLAKTEDFLSVDPMNDDAFCFCAIGALDRAVKGENYKPEYFKALDCLNFVVKLKERVDCQSISSFNDKQKTTHADIMQVYDSAIKIAEFQEFMS